KYFSYINIYGPLSSDPVLYGLKKVRYESHMDCHSCGVSAHSETLPFMQRKTGLHAFWGISG
ncbi:TPA: hypothetical protein ACIB02_004090, partial [Salmonella enterica subsp. enterica serovar Enteritidis]